MDTFLLYLKDTLPQRALMGLRFEAVTQKKRVHLNWQSFKSAYA